MITRTEATAVNDTEIPRPLLRRASDIEQMIARVVAETEKIHDEFGKGAPGIVNRLVLFSRLKRAGLAPEVAVPLGTGTDTSVPGGYSVVTICDRLLLVCRSENQNDKILRGLLANRLSQSGHAAGLLIDFERSVHDGAVTRVMRGQSLH